MAFKFPQNGRDTQRSDPEHALVVGRFQRVGQEFAGPPGMPGNPVPGTYA